VKVLVTGSSGFVGRHVLAELERHGHEAVTFDLADGQDAADEDQVHAALEGCDHLIAGAALLGGVAYLHRRPFGLLAANERITAATFSAAVRAHRDGQLRKITAISSSMVYEQARSWPSRENDADLIPAPATSYGFSRLAVEYFARAARDEHGLPFTITRLFNVTGPGDRDHVITDLARKALSGQSPLRILGPGSQRRHFTWAGDTARGIVAAMGHPDAVNETFNIASPHGVTVAGVAEMIWRKTRPGEPFHLACDEPFEHDVQHREPSVEKARRVLGFWAHVGLDRMLDEVIASLRQEAAVA
jgi:nucleoside-diphosphate-sugar epimerase